MDSAGTVVLGILLGDKCIGDQSWKIPGDEVSWDPCLEAEQEKGREERGCHRRRPAMSWSPKGRESQVSEVWEHSEGTLV